MGTAMRRRLITTGSVLLAVLGSTPVALGLERAIGSVSELWGEGIQLRSGGERSALARGTILRAGDVLVTAGGSMVELQLDDGPSRDRDSSSSRKERDRKSD